MAAKKNYEKKQTIHFCYLCDIASQNNKIGSYQKSLEMINTRWKILVEIHSSETNKSTTRKPSVKIQGEKEYNVNTIIQTSKTKLVFQCGNKNHSVDVKTADQMFNKSKGGFCRKCLKGFEKSLPELESSVIINNLN
ncbi:hypothetical protein JCM30760_21190 [Thiomicrorhabdus hydrogeniphila]